MPKRYDDRPGMLKITFLNINEKNMVLKNKHLLKETEMFKNVYLNKCKSRAERLMELNARAILKRLPTGHNLRVTANGRIQERKGTQPNDQAHD